MINDLYEELISNPLNIIGDMSYDEYVDWLSLGNYDDLIECLNVFEAAGIDDDYVNVLKIELKNKL